MSQAYNQFHCQVISKTNSKHKPTRSCIPLILLSLSPSTERLELRIFHAKAAIDTQCRLRVPVYTKHESLRSKEF